MTAAGKPRYADLGILAGSTTPALEPSFVDKCERICAHAFRSIARPVTAFLGSFEKPS